jgi:hypothetical protein
MYEQFFDALEQAADPSWRPLYRQRDNLRKFVGGRSPKHYASAYTGYQIWVKNGLVYSGFTVYHPHEREVVAAFRVVAERNLERLAVLYGGRLGIGAMDTGTGVDVHDVSAYSTEPECVGWVVSSQRRLRAALGSLGIDALFG